jgi:hypothetical protein
MTFTAMQSESGKGSIAKVFKNDPLLASCKFSFRSRKIGWGRLECAGDETHDISQDHWYKFTTERQRIAVLVFWR